MAIEQTEKDELREVFEAFMAEKDGKTIVAPQKFSVNIDGAKYEFDTQEQLDAALTQLTRTFRSQLEEKSKPVEPKSGAYVSGKETEPEFVQDKYITMMHDSIPEAQKYALDHIFGIPNAVEHIKASLQKSAALESTVAVYQFRERHPEVNITDNKVTDIIEGIRKELNQPFTNQGLEAAYGVAQSRGLLPSPQVLAYQQKLIKEGILPDPNGAQGGDPASNFSTGFPRNPATSNTNAAGSPLGFQPPPSVSRTNPAFNGNFEQSIENMSLEDLEKLLKRAGQL